MKSILDRFDFHIDGSKMDLNAWFIFVVAWLIVVGCSIGSVYGHRNFTRRQKRFWVLLIICVPFFGVLAYLPTSLLKEGYSILKTTKKNDSKRFSSNG